MSSLLHISRLDGHRISLTPTFHDRILSDKPIFWVKFIPETINAVLNPDQDQQDSMLQTKPPFLAGLGIPETVLLLRNRSLPPSVQVRSEGRKEGEPSENVHSRDAMTEPTWMYSRRFSEGSPFFLPGV